MKLNSSAVTACLVVASALATGAIIAACGGGFPAPSPPPVCPTAIDCALIESTADRSCYTTEKMYVMTNRHPNTDIIVSFQKSVRHINSLQGPQTSNEMTRIKPYKSATLGCERTRGLLDNQWDEWSFAKNAACFSTEPCTLPSKPGDGPAPPVVRPPGQDCDTECDSNGPLCVRYQLRNNVPLERDLSRALSSLTQDFLDTRSPKRIDITPIADAITAISNLKCSRGNIFIDAKGSFLNGGNDCELPMGINVPGIDLSGLVIRLPGSLTGEYQNNNSVSYVVAATPNSPQTTANILFYDKKSPPQSFVDTVIAITGKPGKLTFVTDKSYCARLEFESGR